MSHDRITCCLVALLLTTGSTQAQEWQPFPSKVEGFRVLLPGTPQAATKKSPGGILLTQHILLVGKGAYIVITYNVPEAKGETEAKLQQRLDDDREGALKSTKGKLLREQKVRLAGNYRGRTVRCAWMLSVVGE